MKTALRVEETLCADETRACLLLCELEAVVPSLLPAS